MFIFHFSRGYDGLSLGPIKDFSVENLIELVSGITKSNQNFVLDQSFIVEATYADVPTGRGKRKILTPMLKPKNRRYL